MGRIFNTGECESEKQLLAILFVPVAKF